MPLNFLVCVQVVILFLLHVAVDVGIELYLPNG